MEPDWRMISSAEDLEDLEIFKDITIDSEVADQKAKVVCDVIRIITHFNDDVKAISYASNACVHEHCVYLCDVSPFKNRENKLALTFIDCMVEIIESKMLPRLQAQTNHEQLLSVLVQMWNEYKRKVQVLSFVLDPLSDAHFNSTGLTLKDLSIDIFVQLVCKAMYKRFVDAAVDMISREREGDEINGDLLKHYIDFLLEIRYRDHRYYRYFELILQLQCHCYYFWLSSALIEDENSFAAYIDQAEEHMYLEFIRMKDRLLPTTVEMLVEMARTAFMDYGTSEMIALFFRF